MVWDEIQTQAADFGLSQSEAFPPFSPERSDIACERDVILPIKGKCVCMLQALGLCSVVDRKVGLFLRDIAAASMVRMPLHLIICLACSGLIVCAPQQPLS